jgi:cytochrome c
MDFERNNMNHKAVILVSSLALAFLNAPAYAQDAKKAEALAKKSGCLNCHNIEGKKIGAGFKDISTKNKGAGVDKLAADMKTTPSHQATLKSTKEDDLKAVLRWVLSL